MARSFSNARRLSSFFGDQLLVVIYKRGIAAAPQGGAVLGTGSSMMKKGGEESVKFPDPVATGNFRPEFRSNQVYSFLNCKSQIPEMLSLSRRFSTASISTPSIASPAVSHARPLSRHLSIYKTTMSISNRIAVSHARPLPPHLSIYKPQSSSMFSISNRIAASFLSAVALLFYVLCMKTGLICFTYNSFYQILFGVAGFTELLCYSSIPLILLHILHAVSTKFTQKSNKKRIHRSKSYT